MLPATRNAALLGVAAVGVAVGAALLWESPPPPCAPPLPPGAPSLIAARGAPDHAPGPMWIGFTMSGVFENTLPAFDRALARGMTALDVPVRLSDDGVLVVIEDDEVLRTTSGEGAVSGMSFAALEELDAGGGARIPKLATVLDLYAQKARFHLRIPEGGAAGEAIAAALGDELHGAPASPPVWVAAPDPRVLMALRRKAPQVRVALRVPDGDGVEQALVAGREACVSAVELPEAEVDAVVVGRAHAAGVWVFAEGVATAERWRALVDLGVDAGLTAFTTLDEVAPEPLPPQGEVDEGGDAGEGEPQGAD